MRKRNVDALAIKSGPTQSGVMGVGPTPGVFWMPLFLIVFALGITGATVLPITLLLHRLLHRT